MLCLVLNFMLYCNVLCLYHLHKYICTTKYHSFQLFVINFYPHVILGKSRVARLLFIISPSVCAVVFIVVLVIIIILWLCKKKFIVKPRNDVLHQTSASLERDHVYDVVKQTPSKPAILDTALTHNIAYGFTDKK